jgi:hypothetical protein
LAEKRTYRPGDTIEMEVHANDESGVGNIAAHFRRVGSGQVISNSDVTLRGNGRGETPVTVTLVARLPENQPPGEYFYHRMVAKDSLGNETRTKPTREMRFHVDAPPTDIEGPTITDTRFK